MMGEFSITRWDLDYSLGQLLVGVLRGIQVNGNEPQLLVRQGGIRSIWTSTKTGRRRLQVQGLTWNGIKPQEFHWMWKNGCLQSGHCSFQFHSSSSDIEKTIANTCNPTCSISEPFRVFSAIGDSNRNDSKSTSTETIQRKDSKIRSGMTMRISLVWIETSKEPDALSRTNNKNKSSSSPKMSSPSHERLREEVPLSFPIPLSADLLKG